MPISLPLARPISETQPLLRDWGTGLLLVWAVAMLLFGAIASLGQNATFYDSVDLVAIF